MTRTKLNPLIGVTGIAVIVFLYVPMLAVMVYSFNDAKFGGYVWRGFSLEQGYLRLLRNEGNVLECVKNTLVLALASTAISTVLGTLLALAMNRFPWPKKLKGGFDLLVYLPVVTPDIVFAAAMVVAFKLLQIILGQFDNTWLGGLLGGWLGEGLLLLVGIVHGGLDLIGVQWEWITAKHENLLAARSVSFGSIFDPGMLNMIIAHVTFQIAFVAMVVQSRLATFGRTIEEAARDLYASSWYIMRRVTLPLLAPGIFAGAMLAFTLSLDDFVISFFTKGGPESTTLPIWMQAEFKRGLKPHHHALSTIIFLTTVLLVLGLERLTRKESVQ